MPQTISSKNLLLSTQPLAVGVISAPEVLDWFIGQSTEAQQAACDLVELRLDLLAMPVADVRASCGRLARPILFTARHPAEGGKGPEDDAGRAAMLEPFLDFAALIDVELRSASGMKSLLEKAHAAGVGVVGSFHDFQATPANDTLTGARDFAQTVGFDAVKVATYLNGTSDLTRLITLTAERMRLPFSAMGMGPLGRVSRLVLAKTGSLLNYGFLGNSNAPGQWPAAQLKELLAQL
jgi:3-dehydroquinate dehydratase I